MFPPACALVLQFNARLSQRFVNILTPGVRTFVYGAGKTHVEQEIVLFVF